jgi:hypothetical protein
MNEQQHDPTTDGDDRSGPEHTEDTHVIQTESPKTAVPTPEAATAPEAAPEEPTPGATAPTRPRPTGAHLPAILLGLACLVVAGLAIAQELGHLQVDWGDVGPLGIVATGALLVVLGLVGLLTSRRRAH